MADFRIERALKRGERVPLGDVKIREADGFVEYPGLAADGKRVVWLRMSLEEYRALPKLTDPQPQPEPEPEPGLPVLELSTDDKSVRVKGATGPCEYARSAADEPAEASGYQTLNAGEWYLGTPEQPWVGGHLVGGPWSKRRLTTQVAPPPPPPPPAGDTGQILGINIGGYGTEAARACVQHGVPWARMGWHSRQHGIGRYISEGLKPAVLIGGESGSFSSNDYSGSAGPQAHAQMLYDEALEFGFKCVEPFNEPNGDWFYPSENDWNRPDRYVQYLRATYEKFQTTAEGRAVRVLGSYDENKNGTWRSGFRAAGGPNYCHELAMHPYGGAWTPRAASAAGNRQSVIDAFNATGLRSRLTEIGWPTATHAGPTGDSQQWTEQEQMANIIDFCKWVLANPKYVSGMDLFNIRDYDNHMWYGVQRPDGSAKPSFAAYGVYATD